MASPYTVYETAHLGESFDSKLYEAQRAVEVLHVKCNTLPKVDANGQSECPFAERCYAEKEAAAENVHRLISVFRSYLPAISAEVARIERDYMVTGATRDRLHGAEPTRKLTDAEREIEQWCDGVVEQGHQAAAMIEVMESAVTEADKKKWPLGQPTNSSYGYLGAGSPTLIRTDARRGSHDLSGMEVESGFPPAPGLRAELDVLLGSDKGFREDYGGEG